MAWVKELIEFLVDQKAGILFKTLSRSRTEMPQEKRADLEKQEP